MALNKKTKIVILIVFILILIFFVGPFILGPQDWDNRYDKKFDNKVARQECASNPNPVFTHNITDLPKIKMIVPPGSIEIYQNKKIVKPHSYVLVNERAPVYAPADGILVEGAYYFEEGNVYYLHFQTSCEIVYRFDHIMDPIEEIKNAFPSEPAMTTYTMSPKENVKVKAGQLIGYTVKSTAASHGIWFDFGAVNLTQTKDLSNLEKQGVKLDERDYQSVCPYDFFPKDMKQKYYSLFGNYKDNGVIPTLYCK